MKQEPIERCLHPVCSTLGGQFLPCAECPNALLCGDLGECGAEIHREAFEILSKPPCNECGAMTTREAETLCKCGGDRDHCHGCDLWPNKNYPETISR
jgi:hypothetical protein